MITIKNFEKEIENMAVAAKEEHSVQVQEVTRAVYLKLKEFMYLQSMEDKMRVSTVLAETTKGDYILVVGEKEI